MLEVNDFNAVRIGLASPDQIKSWSYGEVTKPETINYRTLKPEKDGLFCERIFGPTKDWECYCGKYKRIRYKGVICDKCGVEVARAKVRRERMGHVDLAAPVSHIWFVKGTPSRVGLLLDISPRSLERVLYFAQYVVTRVDEEVRHSALQTLTDDIEQRIIREEAEARERIDEIRTEIDERERSIEQRRAEQLATLEERQTRELAAIDADAKELRTNLEMLIGKTLGDPITFHDVDDVPFLPKDSRVTPETLNALDERHEEARQKKLQPIEAERTTINDRASQQIQTAHVQADKERSDLQRHIAEIGDKLRNSIDTMRTDLESIKKYQLLTETRYRELNENFGHVFSAGMGAEAVRDLLAEIDLDELADELRREIRLSSGSGQRRKKATKRLRVVEAFRKSGNRPEWMILAVLPVLPPDIRPMVQLDGGRFATSDLNDLYRRVINRNNRLKRLLELGAPEIIIRNEKRMLQEAVDSLIDNGRRGRAVSGSANHKLKSLSDLLKGKQGRFRQNLLGKRVDYSGRSVIVVGPTLKLHQCGLPKRMALELFKPFVMRKLVERGLAYNIKSGKRIVERARPEVWDVLEEVIQDHPVLLNRAPTLHRLGIQAFFPVLIEGSAIQLHPLVCTAFGADFDGDQMAVHVPLSMAARDEARTLMLSSYNLLSPSSGDPIVSPTLDMVLGCYYMTLPRPGAKGEGRIYANADDARLAYEFGLIDLQAHIRCRLPNPLTGAVELMDVTYGRILFNQVLPEEMRYTRFEVMDRKQLRSVVGDVYRRYGVERTADVCDALTHLGFDLATRSGITIAISDITIPRERKAELLKDADRRIEEIQRQFRRGLITEEERHAQAVEIWTDITNKVTEGVSAELNKFGGVYMMLNSGAKGNIQQMRQMAGMRGLMSKPNGTIHEMPIRSSFREGLSVLEYFISTHGARKGLADTAIRTADSGYLTRRLIDVSQDVIVQEADCGVPGGIVAEDRTRQTGVPLRDRIVGRMAGESVVDPATGEILIERNEEITEAIADRILATGIARVTVRSPLTCQSRQGVCQMCYGRSLARGRLVEMGEAVGIIAAQSIGEPGTQLTMRTFHTGGVVGLDITSGLPRVEELFEARNPKGQAVIAEINGEIQVIREGDRREIKIISTETYRDEQPVPANPEFFVTGGDWVDLDVRLARGDGPDGPIILQSRLAGRVYIEGDTIAVEYEDRDERSYSVPAAARLHVETGDRVNAGDLLTDGAANPQDILRIMGREAAQLYLVDEVQKVYRSQGVTISDKHIEIIVRQMLRKVRIETAGDTNQLPGELFDRFAYEEENAKVLAEGGEPATAQTVLLGVTKASLSTDSFLAAASFQETTKVLTEAAIQGSIDKLSGLKENVIIGKLIPAGSGVAKRKELSERKRAALTALSQGEGAVATAERDFDPYDADLGDADEDFGPGARAADGFEDDEFDGGESSESNSDE